MQLFIIECESTPDIYATNAETKEEAFNKFVEYKSEEPISCVQIEVEKLVRTEDNDDIIFF